jgi:hypothetical protein
MTDLEIHPRVLNQSVLFVGIFELAAVAMFGIFVAPDVYRVYQELPNDPRVLDVVYTFGIVAVIFVVIFISVLIYTTGKKSKFRGNYFILKSVRLGDMGSGR